MVKQALLLAILTAFSKVESAVRTWDSPVSLSDPAQWVGGHLPCPGVQRAVLQPAVASVPSGQLQLGPELVLPEEGMLVFFPAEDEAASLTLLSSPPSSSSQKDDGGGGGGHCDGDAVFSPGDYKHWHDPGNWKGGSAATPHLRQIPCRLGIHA